MIDNYGDYWWPTQIDDCRANLLGVHDAQALERLERKRTAFRATQLTAGVVPLPTSFDLPHLQAIHRHLFQDVYDWAGELRVCDLVRPDADPNRPGHQFISPEDLTASADLIVRQIGHPADWPNTTAAVVTRLAALYSSVNVLHPFFEGNGRTNRLFCGQAAEVAGHRIDWRVLAGQQNDLMAQAFTVGHEPVRRAFVDCVHRRPDRPTARRPVARRPAKRSGPELG